METTTIENKYTGNDKVLQLKTVEIKGVNDHEIIGVGNKCGDYICKYKVLNCPNHPPGSETKIPIKGKSYYQIKTKGGTSGVMRPYIGCVLEDNSKLFYSAKGRQYAKEFYVNDYSIDVSESYKSTVYWSPFVQLAGGRDTELSFYTSELKAPYRIVVQGLGEGQVVTGGTTFKVE